MKTILHLTSSRFLGGPERQMLGLAQATAADTYSIFVSFSERGRCRDFLAAAAATGHCASELRNDTPRLIGAVRELRRMLRSRRVDLLCCHGYKSNLVGWLASRRKQLPIIAIAHGWTGEDFKVRCYEGLDRRVMRWMDRVVCVSRAQAARLQRVGIHDRQLSVIRNAVDLSRFGPADPTRRHELTRLFASPPRLIIGAAGRLSPEKGFDVLVQAATKVVRSDPTVGFVLFGDGPLRERLGAAIASQHLGDRFKMAGFRPDLEKLLPALDLLVLPSFTEGLPVIVLEACAAGVPVVATRVGGTPEVIADGANGYLVEPHDAEGLGSKLVKAISSAEWRRAAGAHGRARIQAEFSVEQQGRAFTALCRTLWQERRRSYPHLSTQNLDSVCS